MISLKSIVVYLHNKALADAYKFRSKSKEMSKSFTVCQYRKSRAQYQCFLTPEYNILG